MIKRLLLSIIYLTGMAQGFLLATPVSQGHEACALTACVCPAHTGQGGVCHCDALLSPATLALLRAEERSEAPGISGDCGAQDQAKAFPASLQPHLSPVPPRAVNLVELPRRPLPAESASSHAPEPPQPIPD